MKKPKKLKRKSKANKKNKSKNHISYLDSRQPCYNQTISRLAQQMINQIDEEILEQLCLMADVETMRKM